MYSTRFSDLSTANASCYRGYMSCRMQLHRRVQKGERAGAHPDSGVFARRSDPQLQVTPLHAHRGSIRLNAMRLQILLTKAPVASAGSDNLSRRSSVPAAVAARVRSAAVDAAAAPTRATNMFDAILLRQPARVTHQRRGRSSRRRICGGGGGDSRQSHVRPTG
jgi:hypothetical protein